MLGPQWTRRTTLILPQLFLLVHVAGAAISFPVSINDTTGGNSGYYGSVTAHVQAAGAEWARYLTGSASIDVEVEFTRSVERINGGSVTTAFVRRSGNRDVFEMGAAHELRTGTDPNGATPDVRIQINPDFMRSFLWFDPDPTTRTAAVPEDQLDAMSYFLHELGHAFVFSGWMNGTTGELPATYMSPFDELVQFDSSNFFFVGANAQARYGGQIPVTYGNPFHLGNNSPRPGADLLPDLMNGVVNLYQVRYRISTLDLAIAKDCGLPLLSPSKLLNISTRLPVQRGDDALIGGFIITGSEAKRVIIRAIGPSLGGQGVSGALIDPTLELFDSAGASIANNDDWKEDQQAEIEASTIPPANDAESAIVRTLQPGSYTAVVRGANDTTGIGLVEVYDLTPAAQAKLANISSRGFVATGEDVMIGGFIVGAGGMGGTTVVVRAIGPSLQPNIPNALNDPILDLRDSNGSLLASNDNWKDSQQRQIQSTGIPPSHDREAAVLETLGAGSYTAVVRGKNAATGLGVVEVYNLD